MVSHQLPSLPLPLAAGWGKGGLAPTRSLLHSVTWKGGREADLLGEPAPLGSCSHTWELIDWLIDSLIHSFTPSGLLLTTPKRKNTCISFFPDSPIADSPCARFLDHRSEQDCPSPSISENLLREQSDTLWEACLNLPVWNRCPSGACGHQRQPRLSTAMEILGAWSPDLCRPQLWSRRAWRDVWSTAGVAQSWLEEFIST